MPNYGAIKKKKVCAIIFLIVIPLTFFVVFNLIDNNKLDSLFSICIFKNIFKTDCPGCGLGRGLICILTLNLLKAWGYHKLSIPIFLVLTHSYFKVIKSIRSEIVFLAKKMEIIEVESSIFLLRAGHPVLRS